MRNRHISIRLSDETYEGIESLRKGYESQADVIAKLVEADVERQERAKQYHNYVKEHTSTKGYPTYQDKGGFTTLCGGNEHFAFLQISSSWIKARMAVYAEQDIMEIDVWGEESRKDLIEALRFAVESLENGDK